MKSTIFTILLLAAVTLQPVSCQVKLPSVISSNMVLQRDSEVSLWGWASAGEQVKIECSWTDSEVTVVAGSKGEWRVNVLTGEAGGPHSITFEATNRIELSNLLFGEVWICSGQSNMEYSVKMLGGWDSPQFAKSKNDFLESDYSQVRLFKMERSTSSVPMDDCNGSWEIPSVENTEQFSAIGWFFGTELWKSLNIPVGLISSSWGGTPAESWTSGKALSSDPGLWYYSKENLGERRPEHTPSMLFNAMINPLVNLGIKGVIWYQGESNRGDAIQYRKLFPAMIRDWRAHFNQGDFPFYYVQIAPYNYGLEKSGALIREAQLLTLSVPKTGMVVTTDIGNINDIHPLNKQEVGRRLALIALANSYGFDYLDFSGPLYRGMEIIDDAGEAAIRIDFDYAEQGLVVKGGDLRCFRIAGRDMIFYDAAARTEGGSVIVRSNLVKSPLAVRFGFDNTDEPNLFNSAGLPASPFRTDNLVIVVEQVSVKKEAIKGRGSYSVKMTCKDPGMQIRYTTDGIDPDESSSLYKKPLRVKGQKTVKARAFYNSVPSNSVTRMEL